MNLLLIFLLFQFKHLIADFFLQIPYHYTNKGTYGHPGGIQHAFIHACWSMLVMCFWLPPIPLVLIAVGEMIIHYHIDWAKVQLTKKMKWSDLKAGHLEIYSNNYFHALGIDQLLHQLTYIGMIALM